MVGIVKPLQHLSMFPSNMEAAEFNPLMLCIADEDYDRQNQDNEYNNGPSTDPCDTPSKSEELDAREGLEIARNDSNCTEIPCAASCGQKTAITSTHELVNVSKSWKPTYTSSNSLIVNTVEIAHCGVKELSKPVVDTNDKFQQQEIINSHVTSEVKGQPNTDTNPDVQEVNDAHIETASDIKISNCFSLALDLTKKGDKNPGNTSPENDQPLDLSTGHKTIESSSKILDLSVKNPSSRSTPIDEVPVPAKSLTITQNKSLLHQGESNSQSQSTTTRKPARPPYEPQAPQPKDNNRIAIDDDASDRKQANTPPPKPPLTPIQSVLSPRLNTPLASSGTSVAKQPSQMKRGASYDSAALKDSLIVLPPKRTRMSLDDVNCRPVDSRISSVQTAQSLDDANHRPLDSRISPVQTAQSPDAANRRPADSRISPVQTAQSLDAANRRPVDRRISPIRTAQSLDYSNRRPVDSRISPVQTVQNRPQQVQIPERHNAVKLHPEAQINYSSKGTKKEQTLVETNKKLTDPLMLNKTRSSAPKLKNEPLSGPNSVPSSFPASPIRNAQPALTLSQPTRGQNDIPSSGVPSADVNSNNPPQNRHGISPKRTQVEATHMRSLEGANNSAHIVAQAHQPDTRYQPDMRHLEPYIKEQQRAVDQRIRELEAIKRQLANASASVREESLPPPYHQRVPHVAGNMYAPPMQQRAFISSIPTKQYHPRQIPTNPTIRPHYSQYYSTTPTPSLLMQQNAIMQSQYTRPSPLPTNRGCPVILSCPPVSQTRLIGPPRRMLPPRTEPTMYQSHPTFQRSLPNGGQPPISVNQSHPAFQRSLPNAGQPPISVNQSHPAFQRSLPNGGQPPISDNQSHPAFQRSSPNGGQPPISVNQSHPAFQRSLPNGEQPPISDNQSHPAFQRSSPNGGQPPISVNQSHPAFQRSSPNGGQPPISDNQSHPAFQRSLPNGGQPPISDNQSHPAFQRSSPNGGQPPISVNQSHPTFQRSLPNGGQLISVNQSHPAFQRYLPNGGQPPISVNQSHPAFQSSLPNGGQPPISVNQSHPAFQRTLPNGGKPPTSVNQSQHSLLRQPNSTNQAALFSRPSTTPSMHVSNQMPVPVSYRHVSQLPIHRTQIQAPRVQAPTSPPVYGNVGLTFKSRLCEPVIIEGDIIRGVHNPRKRPAQPEMGKESLHVRRAHSYHPPLSENRMEQGQIPQPTRNHWKGRHASGDYEAPQRPPVSEAQSDICVKCKRKAFFLCSGCRKVWYCSKECQVKDWSFHSAKCSG